jgi:hypothetical protein
MSVPPNEGRDRDPNEPGLDFDPYRYGRPDNPVPPEYAPPGYVPPPEPGPQQPQAPGYPPPPPHPGGHPSYSYPPPPPGYPYAARPGNTKATVALVLGILAIVFSWTSVLDLVLIVPAIVLGVMARGDAKRDPGRGGRGTATAGLVCGLVAIVLAATLTFVVYERVKPCLDKYELNSSGYNQCVHDRLLGN